MNRVFLLRDKLHMTQDEFAEYCGIAKVSIARYEAGANINRANAIKIAQACNVTVDYVLGENNVVSTDPWNPEQMDWAEQDDENIRILARGITKMSKENRQRLLNFARDFFKEDFDEQGKKR